MSFEKYKYYLKKDVGTWYYINDAGDVDTSIEPKAVNYVVNWNEISLKWVRNERYHGIFKKQGSDKVKFSHDACKIIKYIHNIVGGITGYCELYIECWDDDTREYKTMFFAELDFSTYDYYNSTAEYVEIAVMEGNLSAYVSAFENTKYDIPIDDTDCVNVYMDGIDMLTKYKYLHTNITYGLTNVFTHYDMLLAFVRQYGDFNIGLGQTISNSYPSVAAPHFYCDYNTTLSIDYSFNVTYAPTTANNGFNIIAEVWSAMPDVSTGPTNTTICSAPSITAGTSSTVSLSGTVTLPINAGNTLIIRLRPTNGTPPTFGLTVQFNTDTEFSIRATSNSGVGSTKGYRFYQVAEKVTRLVTGSRYGADGSFIKNAGLTKSNYYGAIPFDTCLTSDQALKGIVTQPYLQVSLAELRQHGLGVNQIGIGIKDDKLIFEHLPYFYDKTKDILDAPLENINDVSFSPAPQYSVTDMVIGYNDYDAIDDYNKQDSFNCKQMYQFANYRFMNKGKNTMDMVSPFSADAQFIELTRAQNLDSSKRSSINNTQRIEAGKTFALQLGQYNTGYGKWVLDRYPSVTGVRNATTVYNATITPHANVKRNRRLLKSIVSLWSDKLLRFTSTENGRDLVTNTTAYGIIETDNENLATSKFGDNALFIPLIMKFKAAMPSSFADSMEANPYGLLSVNHKGNTVKGFVISAGINMGHNTPVDIEMLLSPDTDMTIL